MATMAPNLSSSLSASSSRSCAALSLLNNSICHAPTTSLTFTIPKKRAQLISCIGRKGSFFVDPIKRHELGFGSFSLGIPQIGAGGTPKTPELMVAKVAEVAAPASGEETSSQSKSSKKGEKTKYPRKFIDLYQILQYPIITESAIKNIAEENSLLFTVDARADKKMIRDAVTNFFGVKVRKVNTSIRPDGTKKAFIMLSREYNASDIAKSIGIFPSSS